MRCRTTKAACPSLRCQAGGSDADRLERAHAADAENDLLLDARFPVAAVEPRRQLAVPRGVLFEIRVEQNSFTRPSRTRHTDTSTVRLPSGTATTHGVPSGVTAGSIGALAQLSRS